MAAIALINQQSKLQSQRIPEAYRSFFVLMRKSAIANFRRNPVSLVGAIATSYNQIN
ncbi:hypothetical protein [Argonema antarcticum]|uniref:hypothetical protein n=1 Tax=Argonema antarcticum TaxID=2942763 RepID=UPI002012F3A5|nr:hypothetical protein [Argonema antarcticum]MCL1473986.1 hypothetical protein [Argonema antarcticum A004/B2]